MAEYRNVVYLLHFDKPINRAGVQHYIGFAPSLPERIAKHRASEGAQITRRANKEGIGWHVVRVWGDANPEAERALKRLGGVNLCPICSKFYPKNSNQSQEPREAGSYSS